MKTLSPALEAHLEGGATTLCHCWKLTRRDGIVLGFTDHDRPLSFEGITFEAVSGFAASAIETSLGLNVDDLDALGALTSDRLEEADLVAGRFDDAQVAVYRVNWADPAQRVLLRLGNLGEVSRGDLAFSAEVRGLAHRLNQTTGRLYQYSCDATLGDARCTVDLDDPAFRGSGTVSAVEARRLLTVSGLAGFDDSWFRGGSLAWLTGANAGLTADVKAHGRGASAVTVELWEPAGHAVAVGDSFEIRAGCDKRHATCRDKFANLVNFRGFPHMPGNDWVLTYPSSDERNDGTRRR